VDAGGTKARESKSDLIPAHSRSELPKHIVALVIPPAWTDLHYNDNPKGDLLLIGKDSKGRDQYVYSDKFKATRMAEKFARVAALGKVLPQIENEIAEAVKRGDETAACAALILKTGLRPGSEQSTGADVQAYGATTLQGRHIRVAGDMVHMSFVGKDGVTIDLAVEDRTIARDLVSRKDKAGRQGKLFQTTDGELQDYVRGLDGGGFTPKDFRTLYGTATAQIEVAKLSPPSTEKEYKKMVKAVAKIVASKLGNTPTIALQSYINPNVFTRWRKKKWA
jgi:DNA topoisomerase-1